MAEAEPIIVTECGYFDSAQLFDKLADQPWAMFLDSGASNGEPSLKRNANYERLCVQQRAPVQKPREATIASFNQQQQQQLPQPRPAVQTDNQQQQRQT